VQSYGIISDAVSVAYGKDAGRKSPQAIANQRITRNDLQ
jgi:hypothetical protein